MHLHVHLFATECLLPYITNEYNLFVFAASGDSYTSTVIFVPEHRTNNFVFSNGFYKMFHQRRLRHR